MTKSMFVCVCVRYGLCVVDEGRRKWEERIENKIITMKASQIQRTPSRHQITKRSQCRYIEESKRSGEQTHEYNSIKMYRPIHLFSFRFNARHIEEDPTPSEVPPCEQQHKKHCTNIFTIGKMKSSYSECECGIERNKREEEEGGTMN